MNPEFSNGKFNDWFENEGIVLPQEKAKFPKELMISIQEAVKFATSCGQGKCIFVYLNLNCLNVRALMDKFSIEKESEGLLIECLMKELPNRFVYNHKDRGPLLVPNPKKI